MHPTERIGIGSVQGGAQEGMQVVWLGGRSAGQVACKGLDGKKKAPPGYVAAAHAQAWPRLRKPQERRHGRAISIMAAGVRCS